MSLNEEMKAGVTINLQGDASAKLKALTKGVGDLIDPVKNLTANFKHLDEGLKLLNPSLEKLLATTSALVPDFKALGGASASAFKSFKVLNAQFERASGAMGRANAAAVTLKKGLAEIATAGAAAGIAMSSIRSSGLRGGGGGGGGIAGTGYVEGYGFGRRIVPPAAKVPLSATIGAMARPLGTPLLIGGIAAAYLGTKSYEDYGAFQQASLQFAAQGFGPAATNAAENLAFRTHLRGISQTDMMQSITDALTITKSPTSAMALAPQIAKMNFANTVSYGAKGINWTHNMTQQLIQAAEKITGSPDPAIIGPMIELMNKAIAVEGGPVRLTPNTLNTYAQQLGPIAKLQSAAGLEHMIPIIQMSSKRGIIGTQQRGIIGSIMSGKIATQYMLEMERQGMIDKSKVIKEPHGLGYLMKPGAFKNQDLLQTDFPSYVSKVLVPDLLKSGVITPNMTDKQKVAAVSSESFKLVPKAYAGLIAQIFDMQQKIGLFTQVFEQAKTGQERYTDALNTNKGTVEDLTKSWEGFNTALGRLDSPAITAGLNGISHFLDFLTAAMSESATTKQPSFFASPIKEFKDYEASKTNTQTSTSAPVPIYLTLTDGRVFAEGASQSLADMLNRSSFSTPTRFNSSLSPTPPGSSNPIG